MRLLGNIYNTAFIIKYLLSPTGGTCLNDFSNSIDQVISTQCALSWKIVVSEWQSLIPMSLNVGGGTCLIKTGKTVPMHTKQYKYNKNR